jgi:hypothetical protein
LVSMPRASSSCLSCATVSSAYGLPLPSMAAACLQETRCCCCCCCACCSCRVCCCCCCFDYSPGACRHVRQAHV